ncbi:DUF481 domain-containing protein [Bdellovibrio sp. BCCA]|uniref:DUF481 domain-containing protein n=1 Tax=Bdellovibrio sp. BCCA TaxID=3136281 RepID=UPI0030F23383
MRLFQYVVGACVILSSLSAYSAEPFTGEAEAGAIIVSGNNDSESYNAKAKTVYTHEKNVYSAFGRYLKTTSAGTESARNWEIGARYERELTDYLGVFVGQKAESDIFNGYIQRDSTDAGLKYYLIKSDEMNWTVEAGYRYQKTLPTAGGSTHDNMGRLYTEFNKALDKTLSFKYWAEYLPNFTETDAYLANTEASLNIMLNSVFSLKLAYLLQYQNVPPASGKYTTTTTTMNLVAKF